ncbi:gamma-interferon inducible lysosomal thiol reductase gilt [Anaeramoeba flamelloides]|uniref:Gamma-interferon inducible lysosomal thiol reductase gilt n=1 Tax=Anaeramoeba flamelloides TaxID=1746091 RepID=A0AAV8A922_9EUKA|nr:gamma-interferon inducible lysosomal thiol reductase gilt [Anaeramoeba flamelloides]KAJ6234048.1 gamma-interferon inducible lysosomal thiol reductase gilt [Anaeramoeba flamelloides]|eukprot:Anaeramoba_flamelloidesa94305_86.p1 GENE.a94305_86~~a94305_86.p1  ORF type:complete len:207 (+),score=38.12 a94305_86:18-638(+)
MKITALFVFCLIFLPTFLNCAQPVSVELIAASKCPDTSSWEDEVASKLLYYIGDIFTLRVDFLASYQKTNDKYTFKCMHGETECEGNKYELCAQKHYQNDWKYFDYIECLNQNQYDIPQNAETCSKHLSLDWDTLETCYKTESASLFVQSIDTVNSKYPVNWVPTIFINGQYFCKWHDGDCPSSWTGFRDKICDEYQGTKPSGCSQ